MYVKVLAPVLALIVAAPVAAQGNPSQPQVAPGRTLSPGEQIDRLGKVIESDASRRIISAAEARSFRAELGSLRRLYQRYRNYEPRTREHAELMRRIDALQAQVLAAERQRIAQPREPRFESVEPSSPFETPRRPSRIDPDRSLERARLQSERADQGLLRDDVRDMNALRGPAPDKHDEGH